VKAVVHDRYGPPEVLRIEDVERPVPEDDEVLVRVHATSVTRSDAAWRAAYPFISRFLTGLRRPKQRILGSEFAGEVAEVGDAVTEFQVGDCVFGTTGGFRAHAEYVCIRESGPIAPMPPGLTFEQAAGVCDGAILSLNALRPARLEPDKRLLVYGASGSMGTAGVQLGKRHFGVEVTGVCDTRYVDLVRSLGADTVIDYTREDFRERGLAYDAIFDAVGKTTFARCRRALAPDGVFLPTDGWGNFARGLLIRRKRGKRVLTAIPPRYRKADVLLLRELIEAGKYQPVIDRVYQFDEVIEATRHVETGQKTGNVVLRVA
jgi:NADPH:quinone reductase-like Zn-dependent oxidoreductase